MTSLSLSSASSSKQRLLGTLKHDVFVYTCIFGLPFLLQLSIVTYVVRLSSHFVLVFDKGYPKRRSSIGNHRRCAAIAYSSTVPVDTALFLPSL
ncbi:hypothetical protein KC322_g124 [Hortaea werneckii]|nr:hypothetical protein KC322_g124 [Hortaea werneckii]